MKTHIIIASLLISLNLLGEGDADTNDFNHLSQGCPEDSLCSSDLGKLSQAFSTAFKSNLNQQKKFFKIYGLPINAYNQTNPKTTPSYGVSYNSGCQAHRKN